MTYEMNSVRLCLGTIVKFCYFSKIRFVGLNHEYSLSAVLICKGPLLMVIIS